MKPWEKYQDNSNNNPEGPWAKYSNESPDIQQQNPDNPSLNSNQKEDNDIIGALAIGAGGLGAFGIGKGASTSLDYMNKPYRMISPIDNELKRMSLEVSKEPLSYSDLPTLLSGKQKEFKIKNPVPNLDVFNKEITRRSREIVKNRDLFDDKVLNSAVDDVAKHIATNYKPVLESAYDSYRLSQNKIENIIQQSGKEIQSKDIIYNLFGKTINDSVREGVPEKKLIEIKKLIHGMEIKGKITDLKGIPFDMSKPIPFSQVKGNVDSLFEDLPIKAKHVLAKNWGDFLQNNTPVEAQQQFSDMQGKYSNFSKLKNAIFDYVDKDSEQFDTKKLSDRLRLLTKDNKDSGLSETLNALSKGTDITNPMKGLSERIGALDLLSKSRSDYATQLINLNKEKEAKALAVKNAKDILRDSEEKYQKSILRTKELLSQKSAIMEKYSGRMAVPNLLKTIAKKSISKGTLRSAALPAVGALGVLSMMSDPVGAAESYIGGSTNLDNAQIQTNYLNDFEWDSKGNLKRRYQPVRNKSIDPGIKTDNGLKSVMQILLNMKNK